MPEQKQMTDAKDEKKKTETPVENVVKTLEADKEIKEPQIKEKLEEKDKAETPKEKLKEVEKEIKKEVEKKVQEAPKTPSKKNKVVKKEEKEFTIPLREKCRPVPRYKKANKAIKSIKEFLVRHMKVYDRDLKKIKLDKNINESVWARGIKRPPAKIKVKAFWEGELVKVELVDAPKKLSLKRVREMKREEKAVASAGKKKGLMQKAKEAGTKAPTEKTADQKTSEIEKEQKQEEAKEKKSAVVEAGKKMEKAAAKKMKHQSGGKAKQKTQPVRKALAK